MDREGFVCRWINGNLLLEMRYKLGKLSVLCWLPALRELHHRKRDIVVRHADTALFAWAMDGECGHSHINDFLDRILHCDLVLNYFVKEFELGRVFDLSDEVILSHSEDCWYPILA